LKKTQQKRMDGKSWGFPLTGKESASENQAADADRIVSSMDWLLGTVADFGHCLG
jgi:hypothetical protein